METSPVDPRRVAVWEALAEHFLDTETRHHIPRTALECVQAGLSPEEARAVWHCEVWPALSFNLVDPAGEWAGWNRGWLVQRVLEKRKPLETCGVRGWCRSQFGDWRAIERCMRLLLDLPTDAERERLALDLGFLARHAFDFALGTLRAPEPVDRVRLCALYPEPFRHALAPAMLPGGWRAADRRIRAALASEPRMAKFDGPALASRLERALEAAGAKCADDALVKELFARYGKPERHYHGLAHVEACLRWLDRVGAAAERPAEVELALWFHDAVYRPLARNNERRSATLARERLAEAGVPADAVARIGRHIEATRTHVAADSDGALVVDIDLAILGAPPADYDRFEADVRREYASVPAPLYRAGRRRVLQRFLARSAIYRTPLLHDALEASARTNLERRVRELARGAL